MNGKHRLAPSALAALCLFACARDAAAWTTLDPANPRWAQLPVGYYVNRSTLPSTIADIAIASIDAGFATWASPACTEWQAQNLGDATDSFYNDGKNVIRWISGSWPGELGDVDSVIGVTMPVWVPDDTIDDADIVFNNVGFCWDGSGAGDCVDAASIAIHEEGHFLGLGHSGVRDATMASFYGGGSSLRSLDADDIEGICALYPVGGTAVTSTGTDVSACNGCFGGSSAGACAPRVNECAGSAPCQSLVECLDLCDSDACLQGCVDGNRAGAEVYLGMITCLCSECATDCVDECGGGGGAGGGGAGGTGGAGGDDRPKSDGDSSADDSGCGCTVGGPSTGLGGLLLLVTVGALASRRRRGQARAPAAPAIRADR